MDPLQTPLFLYLGSNCARPFGLDARGWAEDLARNAGLDPVADLAAVPAARTVIVANADFAWDPWWLRDLAARPSSAVRSEGRIVMAHVPAARAAAMAAAIAGAAPLALDGIETIDGVAPRNGRGRATPRRFRRFVMPLDPADPEPVERAGFAASARLLTDVFSRTVLLAPAFLLTRQASRAGVSPVLVNLIGAALALAAAYLFSAGHFALGLVVALGAILFDVTDGQLARCTGQVTRFGARIDTLLDWVVMPLWAIGWARGLDTIQRPIEPVLELMVLGAIAAGHAGERVIASLFRRRHGLPMAAWRPIDSRFRLIGARRNPGLAILAIGLALGRPGQGLQWLALWTLLSLLFQWLRFAQANARADRGRKIVSWLP